MEDLRETTENEEEETETSLVVEEQETALDALSIVKQKDDEILNQIVQEDDIDKIKDLTHVFKAYQTKRELLRLNAIDDLQDGLVALMTDRAQNQPHNFNNADLANWMKATQQAKDSTKASIDKLDETPAITYQQTNTQVNVNIADTLSRESRDRINAVLDQYIKARTNPAEVSDVEEVEVVEEVTIEGEDGSTV